MDIIRRSSLVSGALAGVTAGLTISLYRYCVEGLCGLTSQIYSCALRRPALTAALAAGLAGVASLLWLLCRKCPEAAGGGTLAVKARISRGSRVRWYTVLLLKFAGSAAAIASGLSLGTEGPSIQLGAAAGEGAAELTGYDRNDLIISGAAAGIAAAFGAPAAGFFFAYEELANYSGHKNTRRIAAVLAAVLTGYAVSLLFFGGKPAFSMPTAELPAVKYLWIALLAPLCSAAGWLFTKGLVVFKRSWGKNSLWKFIALFLLAGVAGLFWHEICGGGGELISSVGAGKTLGALLLVFAVKALFTMICNASSAPGGILLPTLALGAVLGGAFALALCPEYYGVFAVLGMAGMLAATGKVPLMSAALILEMTHDFKLVIPVALTVAIAWAISSVRTRHGIFDSEIWEAQALSEGRAKSAKM